MKKGTPVISSGLEALSSTCAKEVTSGSETMMEGVKIHCEGEEASLNQSVTWSPLSSLGP